MLRYSVNQIFPIAYSQNNILSSSNYFFGSNPIISKTYNAQHPISYPISNSIIANNYSFQTLPTVFQSYPASYQTYLGNCQLYPAGYQTVPTLFQSAPTLSCFSSYYPLNYPAYSNMAPIAINSSNFHFPSSNIIPSNNNIPNTYIQISDPKKAESSTVFNHQQNPRQFELANSQTLKTLTREIETQTETLTHEIGTQTDITCQLISDSRFPLPRAFRAIASCLRRNKVINESQYQYQNYTTKYLDPDPYRDENYPPQDREKFYPDPDLDPSSYQNQNYAPQYDSSRHQQGGEYPDESPSTTTRSENYERMREENLSGLSQDERYC